LAKVTKAVIAAAGFGTRFLPQTKAMPKEMMPVVDKPIIQYVVEELVEAGIEDIIIVTGYSKRSIEDHFDAPNQDLVNNLLAGGPKKAPLLEQVERIGGLANFIYVRQKGSYGNARPVMNTRHLIGDEPFIYTYSDDLILSSENRFKQMIGLHEELGGSIFPCISVSDDKDYERYGIMSGKNIRDGLLLMDNIVEKPGRTDAPSNLASVGGYLLTPEIFSYLEENEAEVPDGQEFMLQPNMRQMIADGKKLYAFEIKDAKYCDTGDKLEYLKTVVEFGLKRDDIGADFRAYLKQSQL
jgi:UTP--glucose-1-phosphate uridylyltransferase